MKKILISTLFSCLLLISACDKIIPTSPSEKVKKGELLIEDNVVTAPNSVIYNKGESYENSTLVEEGDIAVISLEDSVYIYYNDGVDTLVQLNRYNSFISIFKLLVNSYENKPSINKSFNNNYLFDTGVEAIYISDNTYKFENHKARWAGVEIVNESSILLESHNLLPEVSVASIIIDSFNLLEEPPYEINGLVRTYGSPLRAFLLTPNNPVQILKLLSSPMISSFKIALQKNPYFMQQVVFADAISMSCVAARRIISTFLALPAAACNDFIADVLIGPLETSAWTLLLISSEGEFNEAKKQLLENSSKILVSQAECFFQVTCSGSTKLICHVVAGILKLINEFYNNIAFIINSLAGTYDATTSLCYDEYVLPYAHEFGGHQYEYIEGDFTWQEAIYICNMKGGHLVTIGSYAENRFVKRLMKWGSWTWIGLTDQQKEGEWVWITGEPLTYTNWYWGEPNGGRGENYAHLWLPDGTWNDNDNFNRYPMSCVCEYEW